MFRSVLVVPWLGPSVHRCSVRSVLVVPWPGPSLFGSYQPFVPSPTFHTFSNLSYLLQPSIPSPTFHTSSDLFPAAQWMFSWPPDTPPPTFHTMAVDVIVAAVFCSYLLQLFIPSPLFSIAVLCICLVCCSFFVFCTFVFYSSSSIRLHHAP